MIILGADSPLKCLFISTSCTVSCSAALYSIWFIVWRACFSMALNSLFIISLLNQGDTARREDSSSTWFQKAGLLSAGEEVITAGSSWRFYLYLLDYSLIYADCWVCTSLGLKCCPLWREREWLPLFCMNEWMSWSDAQTPRCWVCFCWAGPQLLSWWMLQCVMLHTHRWVCIHMLCVCVSSGLSTWTSPIWRQAPLLKLLSSIRWEKLMMHSGQDTKTLSFKKDNSV